MVAGAVLVTLALGVLLTSVHAVDQAATTAQDFVGRLARNLAPSGASPATPSSTPSGVPSAAPSSFVALSITPVSSRSRRSSEAATPVVTSGSHRHRH
jgi:hypothetical protein